MTEEAPAEVPKPDPQPPVRVGRAILFAAVVAVVVAASGIASRSRDEGQLARWTDAQAIPTVAFVSPHRGGVSNELVLPGDVEAFDSASLHGQVSGYVQEWRKDIGAKVHKGETLAVIDTPELNERISAAQSELSKAKANLALARVTAQRWSSLRNSAAVSQQAVDEKESDAQAKNAEVEAAQAKIQQLKALSAFDEIVAPFDGVVTSRNVDVGSLVKADSDDGAALFTVDDVHQMRVYVHVPESYAAALKPGMKATLQLPEYPDRKFEATIETTSHAIDKRSRSLLVELIADNQDDALTPGAFARVRFELPPDPNMMRLPASALLFRDNGVEIATVGPNNRIALKKVRIARDLGSEVEIDAALSTDERVVIHPPDSISEGEDVRLASGDQDGAPGGSPQESSQRADAKRAEMAETGRGGN